MPETRCSSRERRGEFSLTASVQNWPHNLPEDYGKTISLFCGANGTPTVKISTQQVIMVPQQVNICYKRDQKVIKFK